jgi:hypothetical protein
MKFLSLLIATFLVSFSVLAFSSTQLVSAQASIACDGITDAAGNSACDDGNDGSSTLQSAVKAGLNLLSVLAGIIAVVMLIIAGVRFITSQGDASSTTSARRGVIYAIIGLVIVALSQLIVQFVVTREPVPPRDETGSSIIIDSA